MQITFFRTIWLFIAIIFSVACSQKSDQLNMDYGSAETRERAVQLSDPLATMYTDEVKPILENRCVVCHGCYDAPCQLKLSSPEGIDRGFSPKSVYATRFSEVKPARLFIDEATTQDWRERGYKPVLNERAQIPEANLEGSVLYQMLLQKQAHPLPKEGVLTAKEFDFTLDRKQQCPSIETYDNYKKDYPLSGMPYGLPQLNADEFNTIKNWVKIGSPMSAPAQIPDSLSNRVVDWENLFNQKGNKPELVARYIYEHLYLGHLYFSEQPRDKDELPVYFRMVRSTTPTGQDINEIASRRPYDDPGAEPFYYRLRMVTSSILTKTHMPYALNNERKMLWNELFYSADFSVAFLPDYQESNPFKVFVQLPLQSRYKFLLSEAEYSIMGFIKGPVCRGQVALNVIQDKFWVFFTNPDTTASDNYANFIYQQADNLELPSDYSARNLATTSWKKYAEKEKSYINSLQAVLAKIPNAASYFNDNGLWKGDENSALTVFRHFDSATVIKGTQGTTPKTAWVINYPLLERIHYLLVSGYDVYGSIRHQLVTRLYMDFLRIEGEMSFITMLPSELRRPEISSWYLDSTSELKSYLSTDNFYFNAKNEIKYKTDEPKVELLTALKERYLGSLNKASKSPILNVEGALMSQFNSLDNLAVKQLAQTSFIQVSNGNGDVKLYTLLRHNEHKNISTLLLESKTRLVHLDTAEVFKGLLGAYPQVIFNVNESELSLFIQQVSQMQTEHDYEKVLTKFGVRRTHPDFWQLSDQLHQAHFQAEPIKYGLFDYNRLENR